MSRTTLRLTASVALVWVAAVFPPVFARGQVPPSASSAQPASAATPASTESPAPEQKPRILSQARFDALRKNLWRGRFAKSTCNLLLKISAVHRLDYEIEEIGDESFVVIVDDDRVVIDCLRQMLVDLLDLLLSP